MLNAIQYAYLMPPSLPQWGFVNGVMMMMCKRHVLGYLHAVFIYLVRGSWKSEYLCDLCFKNRFIIIWCVIVQPRQPCVPLLNISAVSTKTLIQELFDEIGYFSLTHIYTDTHTLDLSLAVGEMESWCANNRFTLLSFSLHWRQGSSLVSSVACLQCVWASTK